METVRLGRTGRDVSVAGLGCGGHSRLGQATGRSTAESVDLVRRAIDLGITFIDTARAYGTEEIVGEGVKGRRNEVVISTKAHPSGRDGPMSGMQLRGVLELSLSRLGMDHVEVFHLHGVSDDLYDHCAAELVPEMLALRDEGKIGHLAISEVFGRDASHTMLQRAVKDDCWDVMMVGFNPLNPTARERVFATTQKTDVGILIMFAVRRALSDPQELRRVVAQLVADGHLPAGELDPDDPLGFLVHEGVAASVVEAAYRFSRHEPGVHVVLTGTGSVDHLEENVASINGARLPDADVERLERLFGGLDILSGN